MPSITPDAIEALLGPWVRQLISLVAARAQDRDLKAFIVGGVVRDLLMNRPSFDIDFAIEGDAIAFADALAAEFGGRVSRFVAFGTAKWHFDDATFPFDRPGLSRPALHLDFAMTRAESYPQPAALPVVRAATITEDLFRRDFTINALALPVTPDFGPLLDPFGGAADLERRALRVLHDQSFIDDPTRILRANRFEQRLSFTIAPHTLRLMQAALPTIGHVTGERLRNDLTLILGEAKPHSTLTTLAERGILQAVHPHLALPADLDGRVERLMSGPTPPELGGPFEQADLIWLALLEAAAPAQAGRIGERLLFPKSVIEAAAALRKARADVATFAQNGHPASWLTVRLDKTPLLALAAAWHLGDPLEREAVATFAARWRGLRPATTGADLRARGLKPGPCFAIILERLRAALIDSRVSQPSDEARLIETWLAEGICAEC